MSRFVLVSLLALVAATMSACGIPLADPAAELRNDCQSNSDCGSSGVCVDSTCVTTSANLMHVYVQIDVPTDAPYAKGTSSLIDFADASYPSLSGDQPFGHHHDVDLVTEAVSDVEAGLNIAQVPELMTPCAGLADADGYVPVRAELRPKVDPVGIPLKTYNKSSMEEDRSQADPSNLVHLNAQTGKYDLSIVPLVDPALPDCHLPPLLFPNLELAVSNDGTHMPTSAPIAISGDFKGADLAGWTVDIVENEGKRVISTASDVIVDDLNGGGSPDFSCHIWERVKDHPEITPVIRLSPPTDSNGVPQPGMPTLFYDLSVDLTGMNHVVLDVTQLNNPTIISVGGRVVDANVEGVPANVIIKSDQLFGGNFGDNVSYRTVVTTEDDGTWSAELMPGDYTAIAIPSSDPNLATTASELKVSEGDLGQGKSLVLYPKAPMTGSVATPQGGAASTLPVLVQPSFGTSTSFLKSVLDAEQQPPGSGSAITSADGSFSLLVDHGELDLAVKPDEDTLLPWLVRARVSVPASADPEPVAMGSLTITNPVVLTGVVRAPSPRNDLLGGSQIRAFVTVENGENERPTAIQIAETTAGPDGSYQLLLPASISQ